MGCTNAFRRVAYRTGVAMAILQNNNRKGKIMTEYEDRIKDLNWLLREIESITDNWQKKCVYIDHAIHVADTRVDSIKLRINAMIMRYRNEQKNIESAMEEHFFGRAEQELMISNDEGDQQ